MTMFGYLPTGHIVTRFLDIPIRRLNFVLRFIPRNFHPCVSLSSKLQPQSIHIIHSTLPILYSISLFPTLCLARVFSRDSSSPQT